jgi:hypothetical protein
VLLNYFTGALQLLLGYFTGSLQLLLGYFTGALQLLLGYFTGALQLLLGYFTGALQLLLGYFTGSLQLLRDYFSPSIVCEWQFTRYTTSKFQSTFTVDKVAMCLFYLNSDINSNNLHNFYLVLDLTECKFV